MERERDKIKKSEGRKREYTNRLEEKGLGKNRKGLKLKTFIIMPLISR